MSNLRTCSVGRGVHGSVHVPRGARPTLGSVVRQEVRCHSSSPNRIRRKDRRGETTSDPQPRRFRTRSGVCLVPAERSRVCPRTHPRLRDHHSAEPERGGLDRRGGCKTRRWKPHRRRWEPPHLRGVAIGSPRRPRVALDPTPGLSARLQRRQLAVLSDVPCWCLRDSGLILEAAHLGLRSRLRGNKGARVTALSRVQKHHLVEVIRLDRGQRSPRRA